MSCCKSIQIFHRFLSNLLDVLRPLSLSRSLSSHTHTSFIERPIICFTNFLFSIIFVLSKKEILLWIKSRLCWSLFLLVHSVIFWLWKCFPSHNRFFSSYFVAFFLPTSSSIFCLHNMFSAREIPEDMFLFVAHCVRFLCFIPYCNFYFFLC